MLRTTRPATAGGAGPGPGECRRAGLVAVSLVALLSVAWSPALAAGAPGTGSERALDASGNLRINTVDGHAFPTIDLVVTPPPMLSLLTLEPADITVTESGRLLPASVSRLRDQDLAVAVVVDLGGDAQQVKATRGAAVEILRRLPPGSRMAVVATGQDPRVAASLTADKSIALEGLAHLTGDDRGSLPKALGRAVRQLGSAPVRPAVLVISGRRLTAKPAELEGAAGGAPLYIATPGAGTAPAPDTSVESTGGRTIVVDRPSELIGAIDEISAELGNQYRITYRSAEARPGPATVSLIGAGITARAVVTLPPAVGAPTRSADRRPVPAARQLGPHGAATDLTWVVASVLLALAALVALVFLRRRSAVPATVAAGPPMGLPSPALALSTTLPRPAPPARPADAEPWPQDPIAEPATPEPAPPTAPAPSRERATTASRAPVVPPSPTGANLGGRRSPETGDDPGQRPPGATHQAEVAAFIAAASRADAALQGLESQLQALPDGFPLTGFVLREVVRSAAVDGSRCDLRKAFRDLAGVGGHTESLSLVQSGLAMTETGFAAAAGGRLDVSLLAELATRLQCDGTAPPAALPAGLLDQVDALPEAGPSARAALAFLAIETSWPDPVARGPLSRLMPMLSLARDGALSQPVLDTSAALSALVVEPDAAGGGGGVPRRSSTRLVMVLAAIEEQSIRTSVRLAEADELRSEWIEALTAGPQSSAPGLVDVILANPIVSARRVMDAVGVTNQGALNLIRCFESKRWVNLLGSFGRGDRKYWVAPTVLGLLETDRNATTHSHTLTPPRSPGDDHA